MCVYVFFCTTYQHLVYLIINMLLYVHYIATHSIIVISINT